MKPFLKSVAIAAVLAITLPALAQAQSSSPRPARPKAAHASTGHHHAKHASGAHARTARSTTTSIRTGGASPSDNVANQLNGQELQRLDARPAPQPMAAPRAAPGMYADEPRPSGGGYIAPSRPGAASMADPSAMGPKDSGGGYIPAPTGPLPMPPPPPVSSPVR